MWNPLFVIDSIIGLTSSPEWVHFALFSHLTWLIEIAWQLIRTRIRRVLLFTQNNVLIRGFHLLLATGVLVPTPKEICLLVRVLGRLYCNVWFLNELCKSARHFYEFVISDNLRFVYAFACWETLPDAKREHLLGGWRVSWTETSMHGWSSILTIWDTGVDVAEDRRLRSASADGRFFDHFINSNKL